MGDGGGGEVAELSWITGGGVEAKGHGDSVMACRGR